MSKKVKDEENQFPFLEGNTKPVLRNTMDLWTKEDQTAPSVHDILCMEVNGVHTVIVTDPKHHCIKSIYKRNNHQYYSRLRMQSQPRCITKLEDNKIAVTHPESKQIVVFSVTPDLIVDQTLLTEREYWGLTALTPTTLAAGSKDPPYVDILDLDGTVMRSVSPLHKGEKVLKHPDFLCTTRQGHILISDGVADSVVCMTPEGEVVFKYSLTTARLGPCGICSTAAGHILFADWWQNSVVQLSESGEFVRDLLTTDDGIYDPYGLYWDERGTLYVSHWVDIEVFVQVFTWE